MQILRLNMTDMEIRFERIPKNYEILGGRGLVVDLLLKEIDPMVYPFSPKNKLIIATGPLAGTGAPLSGRLSCGSKSPLTGGIKESNSGGVAALRMARLGIRAIVIEGKPKKEANFILVIGQEGGQIVEAKNLKGMGVYELTQTLLSQYGEKAGVISIGPAGEKLLASASIFSTDTEGSPGAVCARGGLGAILGSKGVKAIVLLPDGSYETGVKNKEAFRKAVKRLIETILENPQTGKIWPELGTAAVVLKMNEIGGLPTRNFRSGCFEKASEISGEKLYELIQKRQGKGTNKYPCMPGCVIQCYNRFPDPRGEVVVAPFQYETIAMLGANLGIGNLDAIARMNRLCNDCGVDTIEIGVAIGIAMEAGLLSFGDVRGALNLVRQIGKNSPLGRIIGGGAEIAGRVLGVARIPTVKGQAIPAHEPRHIKGMGVTFSTSPMGADHTAGVTLREFIDHYKPEGQVEVSQKVQIRAAIYDTLGLCLFVGTAVEDNYELIADLLSSVYGEAFDSSFLEDLGLKTLKMEREFNLKAGFSKADDRLPPFFAEESIPPQNLNFDVSPDEIDRFWDQL